MLSAQRGRCTEELEWWNLEIVLHKKELMSCSQDISAAYSRSHWVPWALCGTLVCISCQGPWIQAPKVAFGRRNAAEINASSGEQFSAPCRKGLGPGPRATVVTEHSQLALALTQRAQG